MASWALVDVPDSVTEYVGDVLEDAGQVAQDNLHKAADRMNGIADKATQVLSAKILEALG